MEIITGFVILIAVYFIILFFDNFFKTCAHYPYIKLLEETGFEIKLFSLRWRTKALNRTLIKWGNSRPHLMNIWFSLGLYISLALLPIGIGLLIYSFLQNSISGNKTTNIRFEPIIPGINLPLAEIFYYSLTLVCCSIFHEIGHALSAISENVHLIDVGANLWFILPVAFVNLSTERFNSLSCHKRLKILCAGIWHNVTQTFLAYIIYQSLPYIFCGLFDVHKGVVVTDIQNSSPLTSSRGLKVGDVITDINNCKIYDENSWYDCLAATNKYGPAFCVDSNLIHNLDESVPLKHVDNGNLDCCDEKQKHNVCFEYLDTADGILELPSHACLPGRYVVEQSPKFCTFHPHSCPEGLYCFRPLLVNSSLFKIKTNNRIVIYIGLTSDFIRAVDVSSYIPSIYLRTSLLPDICTKFIKYIMIFSLGLAFINVLPFKCTDGQYILEELGQILLERKYGKNAAQKIVNIITWFFTVLLICHCINIIFH